MQYLVVQQKKLMLLRVVQVKSFQTTSQLFLQIPPHHSSIEHAKCHGSIK